MSALHKEEWSVRGCGNPRHGPEWTCHKVVDASGSVVLAGLSRANAERHAMLPAMARALLENVEACDSCKGKGVISVRDGATRTDVACPGCSDDREILQKAGVPLP